eukprot:symbB.v1.2.000060.t1/scaffold2.1/size812218/14
MKPGVTAGCRWTWCEMAAFGNTYVSYAGPGRTRKLPNFRRYFGSEVPNAWRLELSQILTQVPLDFIPMGRAAPVLESCRKLQHLEASCEELQQQKDDEAKGTETRDASELQELMLLYDAELQAAQQRLSDFQSMLEQELLLFQQSELQGDPLQQMDAGANSRDALLELQPGVGGQEDTPNLFPD